MKLNIIALCLLFLLLTPLSTLQALPAVSGDTDDDDDDKNYVQPLEELFQTESVYPQEKGEIQLTLVTAYNKAQFDKYYTFPFIIEYGLTDSWQLEMELNSFKHGSTFKFNQLEIGTKYSFMNIKGANIHTAIGFEVGIPLEDAFQGFNDEKMLQAPSELDEDGDEKELEYEPFLIIAKDFPELNNAQLFTEIRLGFEEKFKEVELGFNIGFFIPISTFCFTTEFNYMGGDEKEIYLTPGLVCSLPGNWEIGLGVPIGLNEDSDKVRVIFQLNYEFETD